MFYSLVSFWKQCLQIKNHIISFWRDRPFAFQQVLTTMIIHYLIVSLIASNIPCSPTFLSVIQVWNNFICVKWITNTYIYSIKILHYFHLSTQKNFTDMSLLSFYVSWHSFKFYWYRVTKLISCLVLLSPSIPLLYDYIFPRSPGFPVIFYLIL